jgi:hypothetical protein
MFLLNELKNAACLSPSAEKEAEKELLQDRSTGKRT